MFSWIILIIGVLFLLGVLGRNKPGEKGLSLKERLGFGLLALVLILIGLNGVRPKTQVATTPTPQAITQPAQTSPPAEPEQNVSDEPEQPSPPTLPNLAWVDITLNLEKWPYDFSFELERINNAGEEERCGSKVDPDTGADLRVCVYSYGDSVTFVEASAIGAGAKNSASWLIPYVATAPFEGNSGDSKVWASRAMEQVRSGKPVERKLGNVSFFLSGNPPTAYTLRIAPMAREKWLLESMR